MKTNTLATLVIPRAIPEIVKRRGAAAIRDWCATKAPWIDIYGCSYHGFQVKRNRPNVIGFWVTMPNGGSWFRALATTRAGELSLNIHQ